MAEFGQLRTFAGTDPEEYPSLEARRLPTSQTSPYTEPPKSDDLIHRIYSYFAKDPSSVLPFPPMIAVTPETVPLFKEALDQVVEKWKSTGATRSGNPGVDAAMAWLEKRYPRFATQAPVRAARAGDLPENALGAFEPLYPTPRVLMNPPMIVEQAKHMALRGVPERFDPLAQGINALAHEMTHARQFAKGGEDLLFGEAQAGVPYLEQQVEKYARQGGGTALESYRKYLRLLKEAEQKAAQESVPRGAPPSQLAPSPQLAEEAEAIRPAGRWRVTPGQSVEGILKAHGIPVRSTGGQLEALHQFVDSAGKPQQQWIDVGKMSEDQLAKWLGY